MSKQRAKLIPTSGFTTAAEGLESEAPAPVTTPGSQRAATREGRVSLPFYVPVSARVQLKKLAAELQTTNQDLLTEGLNEVFRKHGLPPIA
jgi:hypothetical protein